MIEEMLRRAVERLEKLRNDAPPGPWEPNVYWSRFEMYSGLDYDNIGKESLVLDAQEIATVDLVSTLHRTIDAQLAILNAGIVHFHEFHMAQAEGDYHYDDGRPMSPERMYKISPEGRATVALAEAILGES